MRDGGVILREGRREERRDEEKERRFVANKSIRDLNSTRISMTVSTLSPSTIKYFAQNTTLVLWRIQAALHILRYSSFSPSSLSLPLFSFNHDNSDTSSETPQQTSRGCEEQTHSCTRWPTCGSVTSYLQFGGMNCTYPLKTFYLKNSSKKLCKKK